MHRSSLLRVRLGGRWLPTAGRMAACVHLLVVVVAFNAIAGHVPLATGATMRLFTLSALALWCVVRRSDFRWRRHRVASVLALLGAVATLAADRSLDAAAAAAVMLGAGTWTLRGDRRFALAMAASPALYVAAWSLLLSWPGLSASLVPCAESWSGFAGDALDAPIRMGPTPLGFWTSGVLASVLVARFALVDLDLRRLGLGVLALLACAALHTGILATSSALRTSEALALAPAIALGCALPPFLALVTSRPRRRPARRLGWIPAVALASLASVAIAIGGGAPFVAAPSGARVLFLSVDEGPILDWDVPEHGRYGSYSQGMFGLLPLQLEQDGYHCAFSRERLSPEVLADRDVLVVINATTDWTDDELEAVWTWIEGGGRLIAAGDHTNAFNLADSMNRMLAPFGIALRHDSAVAVRGVGWQDADRFLAGALDSRDAELDLDVGVGASLSIEGSARPLVMARFALSDDGEPEADDRARLGDYRYQPGEAFGDRVLAAWAPYGRGRVLVLGDTTPLQNAAALDYDPVVRRLFDWVAGDPVLEGRWLLAFVLAGWTTFCVALARVRRRWWAIVLVALMPYGAARAAGRVHDVLLERSSADVPTAWIDMGHLARLDATQRGRNDVGGLVRNLQRSSFRVRTSNRIDPDALAERDLIVTLAPALPYTDDEIRALDRFMARGGFVIAAAGWPHRDGLTPLLRRYGLDIRDEPVGPVPLNRAPGRVRRAVEYVEAWPLVVDENVPAEAVEVCAAFRGAKLGVLRRVGKGGLVLFGDTYFFSSGNLESADDVVLPNVAFLRRLLQRLRTEGSKP